MPDDKIKYYKNKARADKDIYQPYVPQYQVMGIEPSEIKSAVSSPLNVQVIPPVPTEDNPRTRKVGIRQPYAVPTPSPIGNGGVPNIGNNMEHAWSSDGDEIIDDLFYQNLDEVLDNRPMIDNNDYISDVALGLLDLAPVEELPSLDEVAIPIAKQFVSSKETTSETDDIYDILYSLSENDYLMIVSSVAVCSGKLEDVQEQARLLVFGDHELCDGHPVPLEDILIIKRAPIKVGLFLE